MAFAAPAALRPFAATSALRTASRVCTSMPCAPATARRAPRASLSDKYGKLRGKKIEPVADAIARFSAEYARPVPIVYRGIVSEVIASTHLSVVCAMWRYCKVFAFGLDEVFAETLRFYPGDPEDRVSLYKAVCSALNLDYNQIKKDASEVREWCVGKSEADVFAVAKSGEGPVGEAFKNAREKEPEFEWYYSRLFGIGTVRVMASVGTDLSVTVAEEWAAEIGLPTSKLAAEMASYLSTTERMKQAEQMFAEVAARDARKTAERLAEKAEKAKARAAELEGEGIEKDSESNSSSSEKPVAAGSTGSDDK